LVPAVILAAVLLSPLPSARHLAAAQTAPTHSITWDSHSLLIDGKRVLLYSGEFHYWRLPSTQEWEDRLEKMKAAGLNAVSIYFDWQYHSSAPGQYDFTGVRDVDKLLQITDKLGLYVLARVGPYMNAEADAGGLPGWLLTKEVNLRDQSWNGSIVQAQDSPLYLQYSQEWLDHILPIVARHQVTHGGSVLLVQLENEYSQDEGSQQYMKSLIAISRGDGIDVPIFHNDFYFKGDWSSTVDLYAFDSYPYGFSCCHQWWDLHFRGIDTWESNLRGALKITTPMFVSELQGGSFDGWGGTGYDKVAQTLDGDWLTALDESALAQGTTALNTYMFAGGTSWGYMSEPDVYTSYDYGAPIGEAGQLRPAYYAAHRLALFLQNYGSQLASADAAPRGATASNQAVVVHTRVDSTTGQAFIFLRHGDAGDPVQTSVHLALPQLAVTIPQKPHTTITLPGHGATVLTANVQTGPLHMNYSTSQVLTTAQTGQGPYLVLFGPAGSHGETDFTAPVGTTTVSHNAGIELSRASGQLRLNYIHTADPRVVLLNSPSGPLHLLIVTTDTASRLWDTGNMLLSGPDLVELNGETDKLWSSAGENVVAYGAPSDRPIDIDGQPAAAPDPLMGAVNLGSPGGATVSLPALTGWKYHAESPETDPAFDDSAWQIADKPSTNPNLQPPSTLPMDDYGFHYGFVWYRGHFTATGAETSFTIVARHSYSVYVNGTYIGGGDAPLTDPPHPYGQVTSFSLPRSLLHTGQDNVIAVLTESLGHDEGWIAGPAAQSPQGILLANFGDVQTPITWRIQGAAGGENPADTTRGLFNASGLYGERSGWYLPSFDDSQWSQVSLPDDWQQRGVTNAVGWYRTHFHLNVPAGADAPIGITIPHAADKAVIWVNGWLLGRYWEQKGPQHEFYLPAGVLHTNGDNTVAIAVWNRGHDGGLNSVPSLAAYQQDQEHDFSLGPPPPATAGYWHTSGNRILDTNNRPVRIAAVNWFGMENSFYVPAGLDRQPLQAIVDRVRDLGFNAIRLPFSNELVETDPLIEYRVDANPELKGLHALDIMDRIVAAAGHDDLKVILDDQRSSAGTQPQRNGLWYTKRYPESAWIHDWETLVERYKDDPTVVGVDLRNEPHTGPPGPWTIKAYLHQGSTWGPYNGQDNPATDWRLAAERGGDAVLKLNPHLLIFVEGLQLYPDTTQPNGIDSYWWGGILTPARQYPVELSVPHQLVYSPHEYGPLKWQMPWFGQHMTYASMQRIWTKHWDFLEQNSFPQQAPIFLGEFGTCGDTAKCVKDRAPGSQGLWFSLLMRYMREHPEIGWAYWALNGSNHVGAPTPEYVLRPNWKDVRLPALLQTLRDIEVAPGP
jgi:beta-galactosidase GanA